MLQYIPHLIMLLGLILGFASGAWRDLQLRWFLLAAMASGLVELIAALVMFFEYNLIIYNVYLLPEFMLFSGYAVSRWRRPDWRVWALLVSVHALVLIAELAGMENHLSQASVKGFLYASVILPILHFHLLWRDADQSEAPPHISPHFWASFTIVLYTILIAPATFLMNYLWMENSPLAASVFYVFPAVATIRYMLTAIAFAVHYRNMKAAADERP